MKTLGIIVAVFIASFFALWVMGAVLCGIPLLFFDSSYRETFQSALYGLFCIGPGMFLVLCVIGICSGGAPAAGGILIFIPRK